MADSVDNVLEQFVLQYEFDSTQYRTFEESQDILASGVTIKRFPFSSFFNDSNPDFLERCEGIFDSNGDPVSCDQVTIDSSSSNGAGGGSSGGGTVWIAPGGGDATTTQGNCSWTISWSPCSCQNHMTACGCNDPTRYPIITITCSEGQMRKSFNQGYSNLTCMDCSISDFGAPAFTLTRDATQIDNLLTEFDLSQWHMAYLSNNSSFSAELKNAFLADPNLDQNAGMFTISAGMNGALSGNFSPAFMLSVEGLFPESEADYSQDPIRILFQNYFLPRFLILKSQNPSWSFGKLFYETAKEPVHLGLDAIGMIEGLGTPADLLNAGLYYLEGDYLNGNLSLVAATPVIGLFSTTIKGAIRLKGIIPGTSIRITHVWTKNGNEILFGGTNLKTVMGLTDPTKHAHHILPLQHKNHPVIQKAAKAKDNPFHINELDNGLAVDSWRNTNHPGYNDRIKAILDNYNEVNPNATPEQAMVFLQGKMEEIAQVINNNPTVKLNDLIFR